MISIQYIAGLFDGEGSLSFTKNHRTDRNGAKNGKIGYSPIITITNQNKVVLNLVKEFFNFGQVSGPREENLCYDFQIRNLSDCIIFLKFVLPFLIIKKEKAEDLLSLCEFRFREIENLGYNASYSVEFLSRVKKFRGELP